MAKLREVAALCAMIITKQENAIPTTLSTSDQVMPCGSPIGGNPPCTVPTTFTPCAAASVSVEITMVATTAITAPGTLGAQNLQMKMTAIVPSANANVAQPMSGISLIHVHCCSNQLPVPLATPSMLGIWPEATWMPTPVRKPTSTEADRKSPRKPSRSSLARISMTPQTRAVRLVSATHSGEFGVAPEMPAAMRPADRIAAVAESAPTTSIRDAPIRANISVGKMMV